MGIASVKSERGPLMILDHLDVPIVLAPLAGGPSTPQLAAAVSNAGGFGFLAAGYLDADELARRVTATRAMTDAPIGVNVFVPGTPAAPQIVAAYADRLADEARSAGVALGTPRFEDDDWAAKLDRLIAAPPEAVSFTFGCPPPDLVERLHDAGSEVLGHRYATGRSHAGHGCRCGRAGRPRQRGRRAPRQLPRRRRRQRLRPAVATATHPRAHRDTAGRDRGHQHGGRRRRGDRRRSERRPTGHGVPALPGSRNRRRPPPRAWPATRRPPQPAPSAAGSHAESATASSTNTRPRRRRPTRRCTT